MWHNAIASIQQLVRRELDRPRPWRRILSGGVLLFGLVATASWLTR